MLQEENGKRCMPDLLGVIREFNL